MTHTAPIDKDLDLVLERQIDVPKELVWRALVEPELIKKWFCPKPWQTSECRIDLRPGGEFHTVMQSPEGEKTPHTGCFLEIVPKERLTWTSALLPQFRPAPPIDPQDTSCGALAFTCTITLESAGGGTKYTAHVMHGDAEQAKKHADMGFYDGWNTCLTQMIELLKSI